MKTKSDAVSEISRLLTALANRFDNDDDTERDYLAEHLPPHLVGLAREIPTLTVHLLAAIGDGATNIVGLAAASGQLKGTVSKHVQRLVEAGLVRRDPVPGNRKEIRLSLTNDGSTVVRVHRRMHDEIDDGLREFFLRYTAGELKTVIKVLDDLVRAERRGYRLIADTDQRSPAG